MPHTSRRPRAPRKPDPHAGLDRALDAAASAAPPAPATFGELGLDARLVSELRARGITEPFAIQARTLPDALAGRDVLGRARTGSGKTLAFGLPLLTRLAAAPGGRREKAPRGLVLVPTRELAQQVAEVLTPLGRRLGLTITTVYGGVPIGRQITRVRDADVVVATPGRLIDLTERHACTLAGVEITVLDEADQMADLGFLPAVTRIIDATPPGGQRMFFSATLDRGVGDLVTSYVRDPALHAVAAAAEAVPAEHQILVLSAQDKVPVAAEIAARPGRTLFFVRTRHGADRLARQLSKAGVDAAAIHGDRNQTQRQRALDAFAAGHPRVLVATNVAARGIHVDDVDLVVQFDPPNDHKDYLHRSGRTARAGATGLVVALAEQGQLRDLQRLHRAAGVTAASHHVATGHHLVRQIAASGTPVPPPPAPHPAENPVRTARPARRPAKRAQRQDSSRPQSPNRGQHPSQAQTPGRSRHRGQPQQASGSQNPARTRGPSQPASPGRSRSADGTRSAPRSRRSGGVQRWQGAGRTQGVPRSPQAGRPRNAKRAA
jgi:superfamily II DNA/RNA helicase